MALRRDAQARACAGSHRDLIYKPRGIKNDSVLTIKQCTIASHEAEIRKVRRLALEGVGLEATEGRLRPLPDAFYFLCENEKTNKVMGLAESFKYSAISSNFQGMAFGHVSGVDRIAPFSKMGHFRTIWVDPEARVMTDSFLKLVFISARNLKE